MNHFVHCCCCSFSTSRPNKIASKGCQSVSQTCDFDAKNAKFFWGRGTPPPQTPPSVSRGTPPPHTPLLGTSILTPPILKFCLRYWWNVNRNSYAIVQLPVTLSVLYPIYHDIFSASNNSKTVQDKLLTMAD